MAAERIDRAMDWYLNFTELAALLIGKFVQIWVKGLLATVAVMVFGVALGLVKLPFLLAAVWGLPWPKRIAALAVVPAVVALGFWVNRYDPSVPVYTAHRHPTVFHCDPDCFGLRSAKTVIPMFKVEVVESGARACKLCKPDPVLTKADYDFYNSVLDDLAAAPGESALEPGWRYEALPDDYVPPNEQLIPQGSADSILFAPPAGTRERAEWESNREQPLGPGWVALPDDFVPEVDATP